MNTFEGKQIVSYQYSILCKYTWYIAIELLLTLLLLSFQSTWVSPTHITCNGSVLDTPCQLPQGLAPAAQDSPRLVKEVPGELVDRHCRKIWRYQYLGHDRQDNEKLLGTLRLLVILLLLLLLLTAVAVTSAAVWCLVVGLLVACLQAVYLPELLVTECNFSPEALFRLNHLVAKIM